jgi:thiol-disulfide isomerase/thioredoxin
MKYLIVFYLLVFVSCKNESKLNEVSNKTVTVEKTNIDAIKLEIYDFNGLEKFLNQEDDKVHVVNFWATWCKPCVKELPHFEALNEKYKDKGVEVLLVSLDFPKQYNKKLKPFIVKHNLKSRILVLDDVDMNTWIPKVNKNWSGAIPATLIYNKSKRKFYSKPFTYDELENELKIFLN